MPQEPSIFRDELGKLIPADPEEVQNYSFKNNIIPELYSSNSNLFISVAKLKSIIEND